MKKIILSASALFLVPTASYAASFFSTEDPSNTSTTKISSPSIVTSINTIKTSTTEDQTEKQNNRRQKYLKKMRERYLNKYTQRNTVANKDVREYENAQKSWEKRRYIKHTEIRGTTQRNYGRDYNT